MISLIQEFNELLRKIAMVGNTDKIIEKIRSHKERPNGRNGYDAESPKENLLSEAEVFYRAFIFGKNIKMPGVSITDAEEILFYWCCKDTNIYVDIQLLGDGTYSCFRRIKETDEKLWFDEVPIDAPIPEEILALISL